MKINNVHLNGENTYRLFAFSLNFTVNTVKLFNDEKFQNSIQGSGAAKIKDI